MTNVVRDLPKDFNFKEAPLYHNIRIGQQHSRSQAKNLPRASIIENVVNSFRKDLKTIVGLFHSMETLFKYTEITVDGPKISPNFFVSRIEKLQTRFLVL